MSALMPGWRYEKGSSTSNTMVRDPKTTEGKCSQLCVTRPASGKPTSGSRWCFDCQWYYALVWLRSDSFSNFLRWLYAGKYAPLQGIIKIIFIITLCKNEIRSYILKTPFFIDWWLVSTLMPTRKGPWARLLERWLHSRRCTAAAHCSHYEGLTREKDFPQGDQ